MMKPAIVSLTNLSPAEAVAYLEDCNDDELRAAMKLAADRVRFQGSSDEPDETEIHHALFLLRRARGRSAPSFDWMRVALRSRAAA